MSLSRFHRRRMWNTGLALAVVLGLGSLTGHAQAPKVSSTASTEGLQAKFVVVKAFGAGINTRYYEAGQGEPLVLVHGGGFAGHNSANHWDKNVAGLGKRFHVLAADKMAAGMTDNPPDDKNLNIGGEVEHMYQFIQTMKLGKVHLVGQSRGAGLALLLAVAHPEIVKTLVLVDSGTASPEEACPGCAAKLRKACPDEPFEASWRCLEKGLSYKFDQTDFDDTYMATGVWMEERPKSLEAKKKKAAGAGGPGGNGFYDGVVFEQYKKTLYERLKKGTVLPMPILLYWATDDAQAPALKNGVALYEILAANHPNTRLLITNKAGHFHFREYPEEFNQNVINFIDYWNRQAPVGSSTATR